MNNLKLIEIEKINTVYYEKFSDSYVFSGEKHDFWELVYLARGKLEIEADEKTYILQEGEVIFHKPNEFHALKSFGDIMPNVIIISFYSNSITMKSFENKICLLPKNLVKYLYEILEEAYLLKSDLGYIYESNLIDLNKRFGTEQLLYHALEIFLVKLYRYENTFSEMSLITPREFWNNKLEKQDVYEKIIIYLNANIDGKITVSDICRKFHISNTKLKTIFKERMDCGVITYFNELKMIKAKELINKRLYTYTYISSILGFSSIHYFSQCFKKKWGVSPSEYEEIMINKDSM